jgi:hypothetical protein
MRRDRDSQAPIRKQDRKFLLLAMFLGLILSILIGVVLYLLNMQGRI